MTIENFTPLPAVIGGALIGLASVWLLIANGRIAGVSGILHGLFAGERLWRAGFIAGLLVGFGTRMGGGCTSGHGVCGLGRLSLRSLVAVAIFMAAGMAAAFVVRHRLALPS